MKACAVIVGVFLILLAVIAIGGDGNNGGPGEPRRKVMTNVYYLGLGPKAFHRTSEGDQYGNEHHHLRCVQAASMKRTVTLPLTQRFKQRSKPRRLLLTKKCRGRLMSTKSLKWSW